MKNDNDDEVFFVLLNIFVISNNGKNGSINMLGSVSMNRHVCSKKYEPNNVFIRKIEGGPGTEPSRAEPAGRTAAAARVWGETDLA